MSSIMFSCIRGFIHATLSRYLVFKSRDNYYFPSFHARPVLALRHFSCLRLCLCGCVWLSVCLFVCQPRASLQHKQSLVQAGTNILHNNDGRSCCSNDQLNYSRQVNDHDIFNILTQSYLSPWSRSNKSPSTSTSKLESCPSKTAVVEYLLTWYVLNMLHYCMVTLIIA